MRLRLLYFGILRERLGRGTEAFDADEGLSVGGLLDCLAQQHDIFQLGAGSLRVAVNSDYVGNDHLLHDDDEVAILPPVSGGCGV